MSHFAGPTTYNQLILLGMSPTEITNCQILGLTYDDMADVLAAYLTY